MDHEKPHPMWIIAIPAVCVLLLISSVTGVLCPNGCKCENEILRANCSGAGIEVVPIQLNPELHVMDLSQNRISQLHYTFTFYEKLNILDLSRNKVKSLGVGNFKTQHILKFLNLSNNIIESLAKSSFEGLIHLTELDVSNNKLQEIGVTAFKDLHNLTILRLNGNELDFFEKGTFKLTPKLQALYLDDNFFIQIPLELSNLAQLRVLSMARNLIDAIEEERVPNLQELQTLVLVQNLIQEIEPKSFANMPKIDHLDLSDNNLTVLPTAQLTKLSKLVNLKLSGNTFNNLPPVAFRGLFHLKYLTLTRLEYLESIDARALVDNINLEKINMDYNYKIKTLPSRLFHGNPKLTYVSIRYNAISFLVATHFPLDQLTELHLGGNPLDCNCSMGWLWKLLKDNSEMHAKDNVSYNRNTLEGTATTNELKLDVNDVTCETPEVLHDKKLVDASQHQMDCSTSLTTIISLSVTVVFLVGLIIGGFLFMTKKKSNKELDKELPKIIKTTYNNAPPLPPPRKTLQRHDDNHIERYIMPPILLQNRTMPLWDPYGQHCNGNGNIYEQLNDHRDRPHIVYV